MFQERASDVTTEIVGSMIQIRGAPPTSPWGLNGYWPIAGASHIQFANWQSASGGVARSRKTVRALMTISVSNSERIGAAGESGWHPQPHRV